MKFLTNYIVMVAVILWIIPSYAQLNRSINGKGNNLLHQEWGTTGSSELENGTIGFGDGYSSPAGSDRPNARYISNMLNVQNTLENDPRNLSAYCWVWGQFIDHDITLVTDNPNEGLAISIPKGDVYFDPQATGSAKMNILRNVFDPNTGTEPSNPRKYINHITSFVDASTIYGSDESRAKWLRTFTGGKIKVSSGNLLPWNTITGEYNDVIDPSAPEMAMPLPNVTKFFVSGDVRANENPFLTAMHTLFTREHNRLCTKLANEFPSWNDEELYQRARKLVGAEIQAITYEEWLPELGMELDTYLGYNASVDPGIMNVFSAAAYRYGHTTINSVLVRMDNAGNYMAEGDILLRDAYFNPGATKDIGGIEPYLIGMSTVIQQDFDCKIIDDLRNFLFGAPGAGGMDLAVINIERGRERGLPDYNTVRSDFGLERLNDFNQMSSDLIMNQTLKFVYSDVNKIDPWVGMLAENHMHNALFGETAMTIVKQQFISLRDGDRYYYLNDDALSPLDKLLAKTTRLADVIRRNAPVTIIKDNIFEVHTLTSATKDVKEDRFIDFALYPNPVHQMVFLRIPSETSRKATLQVVDMQGKVILEREANLSIGNNTITLTLPFTCTQGSYAMIITSENKTGQKLFIKVD